MAQSATQTVSYSLSNISSSADVSTKGTLIEAKNVGRTHDSRTVNGVTFVPGDSGMSGNSVRNGNSGRVTGNSEFDALLNTALRTFDLLKINGLRPGHDYEAQFFIFYTNSCCSHQIVRVNGGDGFKQKTAAIGTAQVVTARFTATDSSIRFHFISMDDAGQIIGDGYLNAWQIRNLTGGRVATFNLPATRPWFDTGMDVSLGDNLVINATGQWSNAQSGPMVTPDGFGGEPLPGMPFNGSFAALIGRIGNNGAPFLVGSNLNRSAPGAGRLFLQMNDSGFADNRGELEVIIEVER